jgi:branched-chain amino acid transport system substrate-binding protein
MKLRRIGAVLAAASLLVAACGGDDDESGADTAAEDTAAEDTAAAATTAPAEDTAAAATTAPAEETAAADTTAPAESSATVEESTSGGESAADLPATAGEGCGLNNGTPAEGDPIVVGHVTTSIPGTDFSTGPTMMEAYFNCVNDNGGINGRPIQMVWENDNGSPEDAAAGARKLIEEEGVVAMVGGFSILDCPVNAAYYEEVGYNVIVAGVPGDCFGSPNIAAINMGPGYSALGAAQFVVEKGATGKLVTSTGRLPGSDYNNSLAGIYAQENGLEWEEVQLELPIADPTSVALDLVNRAGEGGGVVLNFTPPEGLKILKAAEEQGVIDQVIWGSSTPLNDSSVAVALGAAWEGKLNINAEFSLLDDPRPEVELYRQVSDQYNPDAPYGSFQQMGFMIGRIIVHTMLQMDPAELDDPVAVNAAIKDIKMFASDHLCKPWYFGGLPDGNVPNNWDYNVLPNGVDKMIDDSGCFEIAEVEPILTAVRAAEAAGGLTTADANN